MVLKTYFIVEISECVLEESCKEPDEEFHMVEYFWLIGPNNR